MVIDFYKARALIAETASERVLEEEWVPLSKGGGRVGARVVHAPLSLPSFDNSAMDGFAVRAVDLQAASAISPVSLPLGSTILASSATKTLQGGHTMAIMTGAVLPKGADAVVRIEDVVVDAHEVRFSRPPRHLENIREKGSDIEVNKVVLSPHETLCESSLMMLAALGLKEVCVKRKVRAAVFTTGDEIMAQGEPLLEGHIYNSNLFYAKEFLRSVGVEVVEARHLPDKPKYLESAVKSLDGRVDIILSSGAVSVGKADFVPSTLQSLGAKTLYHHVALRPGKPNFFAKTEGGTLYFGLPGNPVSTVVGLRFFVYHAVRQMLGLGEESPIFASLTEDLDKPDGLTFAYKSTLFAKEGRLFLKVHSGQQSYRIASLASVNAWLLAPSSCAHLTKGELVTAYSGHPHSTLTKDGESL